MTSSGEPGTVAEPDLVRAAPQPGSPEEAIGREGEALEPSAAQVERPVTWVALANAWALRDAQYARLPKPLSDEQIAGIIEGRKREVGFLPPADRRFAWGQATTWYPPEHGQ